MRKITNGDKLNSLKFQMKMIPTRSGLCVYHPSVLDKNIKKYFTYSKFRDEKTKGDIETIKLRVRRDIKKKQEALRNEVLKDRKNAETIFRKHQKLKLELQRHFSLVERADLNREAISKLEIMMDIVAPFAIEIRQSKKTFTKNIVSGKLSLLGYGHDSYICNSFYLRKKKDVIKEVVRIILNKNYRPDDFRSTPKKVVTEKHDSIEYQNLYQMVNRAYDAIKEEFQINKQMVLVSRKHLTTHK